MRDNPVRRSSPRPRQGLSAGRRGLPVSSQATAAREQRCSTIFRMRDGGRDRWQPFAAEICSRRRALPGLGTSAAEAEAALWRAPRIEPRPQRPRRGRRNDTAPAPGPPWSSSSCSVWRWASVFSRSRPRSSTSPAPAPTLRNIDDSAPMTVPPRRSSLRRRSPSRTTRGRRPHCGSGPFQRPECVLRAGGSTDPRTSIGVRDAPAPQRGLRLGSFAVKPIPSSSTRSGSAGIRGRAIGTPGTATTPLGCGPRRAPPADGERTEGQSVPAAGLIRAAIPKASP